VVLVRDRFVRGINLNNAWQGQFTVRYTFN
jgi:hypothetical protein